MKRLILIGTVHQSTKSYSALDLYNILESVRPDVIFEELPPELHEDQKTIKIPFGEENKSQERAANYWYFQKHHIPIVPVDLPGRNQLYNASVNKELYIFWAHLLNDKKTSLEDRNKLNEYFSALKKQKNICETKTSIEINSEVMDNLLKIKRKFLSVTGLILIDKYSNDQSLKNYFEEQKKWTEVREKHMVKTIIENMKKYNHGVFPVGADHRIGLKEKLINNQNEINVLEYWEQ